MAIEVFQWRWELGRQIDGLSRKFSTAAMTPMYHAGGHNLVWVPPAEL